MAHVASQKPLLTAIPHRKRLQFAMTLTDSTWVDLATSTRMAFLDILSNLAIPSAHMLGYGYNFIFQNDGVPCHRAYIVR